MAPENRAPRLFPLSRTKDPPLEIKGHNAIPYGGKTMTQQTLTKTRFKTGETCQTSGRYRFDGYTDGTSYPSPTSEEREIPLSRGETFPPIRSCNKACWWVLVSRI